MKQFAATSIVIGFVLMAGLAVAQDVAQDAAVEIDAAACEEPAEFGVVVADAAIAWAESDEHAPDELTEISAMLATWRVVCGGLVLTSEEYGSNIVTDPIAFDGFYRVTLEADVIMGMTLTGIEGDCGLFFNISLFEAGSAQGTLDADGCVGVLQFTGMQNAEWTATFEKLQ